MDNTSYSTYLRPSHIRQRWGFTTEAIRRMVRQGRLPAVRIGKRLLIDPADVEAFENKSRVVSKEGRGT
jgi:excisionase family DNA binding protein